MSFWLKQQQAKKAAKPPRVANGSVNQGRPGGPTGAAQKAALNRLGCNACPLNRAPGIETRRMPPTLASSTEVYFLGESPDLYEDTESGEPLTGQSGRLLRECIPDDYEDYCSFDNIVRDRPPKGDAPQWPEIECCRPNITKSIEQAKPKIIIGLGTMALSWMLNSTDMPGMRGRIFLVRVGNHTCYFMPTYHPSFILKIAYDKKKPLKSKLGHCFRHDIRSGCAFAGAARPRPVHIPDDINRAIRANVTCFDGSGLKHLPEVLELLQQARKAKIKAVDIETKGLRPYAADAAIMSMAISFDDTHFSFAVEHPKALWKPAQLEQILAEFELLLTDDTLKIAHNDQFELEWFAGLYGKEVIKHGVWHDTMLQAHVLDERRGSQTRGEEDKRAAYQALNFLVKQHFGIAYKGLFKLNKKDMSKSDLGETLIYNGVDTKFTLKLFHLQAQLLEEQGLTKAYDIALPRQVSTALMQCLGMPVNQIEVKKVQKRLEGEIAIIEGQIRSDPTIKKFTIDNNGFNPNSQPELLKVFGTYLKCPEIKIKDKKGTEKLSVGKGVLEQIDHPLADLIVKYRNRSKLKSTYADPFELGVGEYIWPDGLIHTNFNTTFAETSRLSSDEPNQQNWPQRADSWVRAQVEAPEGHVILALDYGQLEGCTAAMCSKDKVLVKALWDDYDIHMEWAQKLAKRYPDSLQGVNMDKFRSRVKNKLVFPAIFGAKNSSIAEYLSIPIEPVDDLMEEFWATFNGLAKWQSDLMKFYYEHGYVESLTGRRRRYPMTRNEAVNFPIQCLQKGSRVLTSRGLVPIHQLVGRKFKAWTGFKWAEATAVVKPENQLAEITLNSGLKIKCDISHYIKNELKEWVPFRNLKIGDWVALPRLIQKVTWSENFNLPYLLGSYIGDGCFKKVKTPTGKDYYRFSIVGGKTKRSERLQLFAAINNMGFNARWNENRPLGITKKGKRYGVQNNIHVDGIEFGALMIAMGAKPNSLASTKRIPSAVWTMPAQDQADFLAGLLHADGSRVDCYSMGNLHMCNKELLEEVQILASSLGYDSTITKTPQGWKLSFRNGTLSNNRIYPFEALEHDLEGATIISHKGDVESISERNAWKRQSCTQSTAERIYQKYMPNKEVYRFDKIVKIEIFGKMEKTYTLCVDDPLHQFVADGVVHKNSFACDIVCEAMNRLSYLAATTKQWYLHPHLNIHDDLTFIVPDDDAAIEDALTVIYKIMLTPTYGKVINVPLSVKATVGRSWYGMYEIGKFWSHKDV